MKVIADALRQTLEEVLPALHTITDEEASQKPLPGKWSKKEIMGHLIDSASNNQHKFVRTMAQPHLDFVGYTQDFWVERQHYNQRNWQEIVALWHSYNLHIAHIIASVAPDCLQNTIRIENNEPLTLAFIMEDYAEHLKHHLKVVLADTNITSKFSNTSNS